MLSTKLNMQSFVQKWAILLKNQQKMAISITLLLTFEENLDNI